MGVKGLTIKKTVLNKKSRHLAMSEEEARLVKNGKDENGL